ncbi:MAG: RagB/SusD family nutrient uptake outer membrane protein [Muribaculaceae bacterium]|nr:RagB/SusD family nutrient uptake outer membrane protein [Muribaculaceae bacterium]
MNKKLYKGLAAVITLAGLSACSSDYLQTEPITSISDATAVATTEAAQMSVYGIGRIMNTQLSLGRSHSGENSCLQWIGEGLGPDNVSYFNMGEMGRSWSRWESLNLQSSSLCRNMWDYCYMIISRANTILATIDDAEGSQAKKDWIKAQCLTLRAHGYFHALQWFAPRWVDSNNGSAYAVVLRTDPGTDPAPIGTMNEVMDLIYSDLDEAISLFSSCGQNRSYWFEPDIDIAYGTYARAALLKNDWSKAQSMAHNARQGYPVMSNEEYMSGLIEPTSDYMWTNPDNDIYYSAWGCWFSCNGAYPANWSMGLGINMDLYRLLDPNDIRRQCFFTPDKAAEIAKIPGYESVASVTEADFWNANNVVAGTMDCIAGGLYDMADGFVRYAMNNNPKSGSVTSYPFCRVVSGVSETSPSVMQIGGAVKMWCVGVNGVYGDSYFPWMRATEMVLTEAEAAYMAGDVATAKSVISELNSMRIPGYTAPDGEALLEDIRLSRRIELWGEGHCWTDFKRWNLPMERRVWVENDVTSGNTPANYAIRQEVSAYNGWRLMIPRSESDFNSAFDRTLLNYKD